MDKKNKIEWFSKLEEYWVLYIKDEDEEDDELCIIYNSNLNLN